MALANPSDAPVFHPTPKQILFHQAVSICDEVGYGGARGGGKTEALCWLAFEQSMEWSGNEGAIFRRDLIDLRSTTLEQFREWCGTYYPHIPVKWCMSSPIYCDIDAGGKRPSRIWWRDTKDPDSIRSANWGWVALDEATEISYDFVQIVRATLGRRTLPDGRRPPARLIWGSNPGPGWCKDQFPVGREPRRTEQAIDVNGEQRTISRAFIPSLPRDNPHLPDDFEARLRLDYPDVWVRRWLEGDWDAFEGQVFAELDTDKHVSPFSVDLCDSGYWTCRTMDWGFRNPAASYLVSIDFDGDWWVWRERYGALRTLADWVPILREQTEGVPALHAELMDPAAVDQSSGAQIYAQFNAEGFRFMGWPKRKHGADGSIMFVKRLMQEDRLHICPSCVNLIRELKECQWEPLSAVMADRRNEPERMLDKNDHGIDALFGACEFWRTRMGPAVVTPGMEARQAAREMARSRQDNMLYNMVKKRDEWGKTKPRAAGWGIKRRG